MDLLHADANLTPAELAKKLKVSPSYARTLLRRARERVAESQPAAVPARAPVSVQRSEPDRLSEVLSRLESAEQEIHQLRALRTGNRSRWDLSRRAEAIRRGLAGEDPAQIAAGLHVPQGEVRFILKVHRLMMNAG